MFRELREAWLLASWKKRLKFFGWIGAGMVVVVAGSWVLRNWLGTADEMVPFDDELVMGEWAGPGMPPRPGGSPAALQQAILDRNFEALGGVSRMESISSLRVAGEVTFGDGEVRSVVVLKKQGARIRIFMSTPTGQFAMGLHPGDSWRAFWRAGELTLVEELEAEQRASLRRATPVVSELFHALRQEWPIAYIGQQTFNHKPAHTFEVELSRQEKLRIFIDPETYLDAGREEWVANAAGELNITRQISSDYMNVDGYMVPGRVVTFLNDIPTQTFVVSRVQLNPGILDSTFERPQPSAR